MEITFLGTSCAVPTKERNHVSIFVSCRGEGILLDCGEGTQRQLKIAGIKPTKITRVFISHWHGDHVLGLAGLIDTVGFMGYTQTLHIYGPKGSKEFFSHMSKSRLDTINIKIDVHEVGEGRIYDGKELFVEAASLEHVGHVLGYSLVEKDRRRIDVKYIKKLGIPDGPLLGKLQEGKPITWKGKKVSVKDATYVVKGKKLAYVADTLPCKGAMKLARNADLLICDSTYHSALQEKAEEFKHMSSRDAGLLANQAGAKQLALIHFSARYKSVQELEQDARDVFDNSFAAKDFMKIEL